MVVRAQQKKEKGNAQAEGWGKLAKGAQQCGACNREGHSNMACAVARTR